jgi:hypothetical protein
MPRLPLALLALLGALLLAACGAEEEELHVIEGEPIEHEDTSYNVVISRFLNPADEEDSAYLVGQPRPPEGEQYFGVFLQIENESEEATTLPETMTVIDTLDEEYEPVETESPYSLPLGGPLPAGEEYPLANSVAADGPTGGSLVLFLIQESSTENRPLELEVPLSSSETATVELDI